LISGYRLVPRKKLASSPLVQKKKGFCTLNFRSYSASMS
jgi:hypothetical protein